MTGNVVLSARSWWHEWTQHLLSLASPSQAVFLPDHSLCHTLAVSTTKSVRWPALAFRLLRLTVAHPLQSRSTLLQQLHIPRRIWWKNQVLLLELGESLTGIRKHSPKLSLWFFPGNNVLLRPRVHVMARAPSLDPCTDTQPFDVYWHLNFCAVSSLNLPCVANLS